MTDADSDFWKTFDNWLSLYDLSESKEEFLKPDNKFILYTNKELSNSFNEQIKNLRNGSCGIEKVILFLKKVEKKVSYYPVVKKMLDLDKVELNKFLHKVEVMQVADSLRVLYEKFLVIYNMPTKADQIVSELLGDLYKEKINAAKNHQTLSYEKSEFLKKYRGILQKVSDDSLVPIQDDVVDIPKDVKDIPFIKYLDEIDVLNLPDSIEKYYGNWFCYNRSIQYYYSVQLMTPELEKSMNYTAKSLWSNTFRQKYPRKGSRSSDAEKIDAAQDCFYTVMEKRIPFDNARSIYPPFSSGWFLNMTNDKDHPSICWHIDVYPKLKKTV